MWLRDRLKIVEIFQADGFIVLGQDYKTAYILTYTGSRSEFGGSLAKLDKALREILLNEILPEAEKEFRKGKDEESRKKLKEIQKLKATLRKNPKYKFDIFFGLSTVKPTGSARKAIDVAFLLLTEALKGAAIARLISKGRSLKTRVARRFVTDIRPDSRAMDQRGKEFKPTIYLRASKKAGEIKSFITAMPSSDNSFLEYNHIYVDTVWTVAFFKYRRQYVGNPDVMRDVRKKKLERPPAKYGNVKYTFLAQVDLLELWLVVLNMLDFIKEFLLSEFRTSVVAYHDDALSAFDDVNNLPPRKIDWQRLERLLTSDHRETRMAVLGSASEFLFFSFASDHPERIFFSFDIRDLGVDLALLYEYSNEEIEDHKYTGVRLMEETFRSSDPIVDRKRFTYDRVVYTFRMYHALLAKAARVRRTDGKAEAQKAFGSGMRTSGAIPGFDESVQIMLGGDEVFVSAHPYFAAYIHNIIGDLDRTPLKSAPYRSNTLDMRAAVAFSRAKNVAPAKQREENQYSHYQAMKLADSAPGPLKELERTQRRIERLIEKLKDNEKKKDRAPEFTKALKKLTLTKLFVRVYHGHPKVVDPEELDRAVRRFGAETVDVAKDSDREFVDFNGNVVDPKTIKSEAEKLEAKVRRVVGRDNTHVDPPPARKPPKWLDDWLNPEK